MDKDKVRFIDKLVLGSKKIQNKLSTKRFAPRNILLIFSHCLQLSTCKQNITNDLNNCKRCGKCQVTELIELAQEFGINYEIATGGRLALQKVMSDNIKGVVAIACEQELSEGARAALKKKIIPIPNIRPNGPCKDTKVNISAVKNAIKSLINSK